MLLYTSLIRTLVLREISTRFRGSLLGATWAVLTPLAMLAVYTFVFGKIFRAEGWGSNVKQGGIESYALILFCGLTLFMVLSETLLRTPGLIRSHRNYVNKIVFPLDTLPVVVVGAAAFQACISLAILLCAIAIFRGTPPVTALALPLVLLPYLVMLAGIGWITAALGVYVRDLEQIAPPIVAALMFLSAIFYPLEALPDWARETLLWTNPAILPIEEARRILFWGELPNWTALAVYMIVAATTAILGRFLFLKLSKGFADVV